MQHLGGAIVGSFLENILPWPGVSLLLLGGRAPCRASCRALVELRVELNAGLRAELRAELHTELRAELYAEPPQSFVKSLHRVNFTSTNYIYSVV